MRKLFLLIAAVAFTCTISPEAQAQTVPEQEEKQAEAGARKQLSEEEKIAYLIAFIRNLEGATFIRNGKDYQPGKAAEHLEKKLHRHRKEVHTAQEFVEGLAAYSTSKEPYLIRFSDGHTLSCREVLLLELNRLNQE